MDRIQPDNLLSLPEFP
ncbi:hypothetical protein [Bradyrhizobium yuanmingense]